MTRLIPSNISKKAAWLRLILIR